MSAKKFNQLRDELYERSPASEPRVAAQVARLNEQLGLAGLRVRASKTQAEIAETIGTTQSAVSRIERQDDLLISSLNDYIGATGGRLRLIAEYHDHEFEIDLPSAHRHDEPHRSFRVIWQNGQSRELVHVGWLTAGRTYTFTYTPEAHLDPGFEPFPGLPDLREEYESRELFAVFANRVATGSRREFHQLADALGMPSAEATPIELLARTWGRTPHDATIQIVPEPHLRSDGVEVTYFLASGVRHVDEAKPERTEKLIAGLRPGIELRWTAEPDNPVNDRAVRLEIKGRQVGWMPNYLLDDIHKAEPRMPQVFVEHANGTDAPWHLRLLCRLELRDPA